MAFPSFPRLMLWKDTIDHLRFNNQDSYKLRADLEKYLYPINASTFNAPIELIKIIELNKSTLGLPPSTAKGLKKMELFSRNAYKPWMAKNFMTKEAYFQNFTNLARLVKQDYFSNDRSLSIEEFGKTFIKKLAEDVE